MLEGSYGPGTDCFHPHSLSVFSFLSCQFKSLEIYLTSNPMSWTIITLLPVVTRQCQRAAPVSTRMTLINKNKKKRTNSTIRLHTVLVRSQHRKHDRHEAVSVTCIRASCSHSQFLSSFFLQVADFITSATIYSKLFPIRKDGYPPNPNHTHSFCTLSR